MRATPRLLPLIAVAIGGVVAVRALADVQAVPQLLAGAQAQAEEAPVRAHRHPAAVPSAAPSPNAPLPAAIMAPRPAPIAACAQSPAELAREAGLSPGELTTLQNLGARRGQLDDRERNLGTQLQLLSAAEAKVDAKMTALNALKAQMQGLVGQADARSQAEIDRLVTVYEKMKPRDAATIMATLDDRVRIPVAAKMKERNLADILAQMPTLEAKKITESLAHKFSTAEADAAPPTAPQPKIASAVPPDNATEAKPAPRPRPAAHTAHKHAIAKADTPTMKAARTAAAESPPPALAPKPPAQALAKPGVTAAPPAG